MLWNYFFNDKQLLTLILNALLHYLHLNKTIIHFLKKIGIFFHIIINFFIKELFKKVINKILQKIAPNRMKKLNMFNSEKSHGIAWLFAEKLHRQKSQVKSQVKSHRVDTALCDTYSELMCEFYGA